MIAMADGLDGAGLYNNENLEYDSESNIMIGGNPNVRNVRG